MSLESSLGTRGLGFEHKDPFPCLEVQTKRVDIKILQSYSVKNIPFHAILFSTKDGIKICVDPAAPWVKRAINILDNRTQNQSPESEVSGSKKSAKKPAKKSAKKVQRKQKRKTKPNKKAAPLKSIMAVLTTRTPAVKP
ncbi:lymphotactin-like isoform X2 [Dendropsophus ebraccatus]|uniref:lymphotactin-like isoform X2 n=1 Tax=Dendropsophus ebraccatus TaxID=150705 RepID=UPI0038313EB8